MSTHARVHFLPRRLDSGFTSAVVGGVSHRHQYIRMRLSIPESLLCFSRARATSEPHCARVLDHFDVPRGHCEMRQSLVASKKGSFSGATRSCPAFCERRFGVPRGHCEMRQS
eukprot:gene11808-biopygen6618